MKTIRQTAGHALSAAVLVVMVALQAGAQQDARSVYLEAREHLIEERFEQALTSFRRVVAEYPESTHADDAQFYIGYTLERLGMNQEAIEAYTELIRRWPDSMRVDSARSRQVELMGGVEDPAFGHYLEQILSGSTSWQVKRDLAFAMARSGDLTAVGILEDVMQRESSSRQIELIRILSTHLADPVARNVIAMGVDPSKSSSVQLLAVRTLKPVAGVPEVTPLLEPAISRSNSSSVQQEVIQTLAQECDKPHVRAIVVQGMGRGYSSSVQLMAVRTLGGYLLEPQVRPAVLDLFRISAPSSVQLAALEELAGSVNRSEIAEVLGAAVQNSNPSSVQQKAMQIARSSSNPEVRAMARLGLAQANPSSVQLEAVRAFAETENDPASAEALAGMLKVRNMSSSVQLAGVRALASHLQTPAAPVGIAAALEDSKPSSVQLEALELAAPLATHEAVREALLKVMAPGSTPSSVQLKAVKLLEQRIEEPQIQQIVSRALHHSNPSSVQLAAVAALEMQAGQPGVREVLTGGLTRRNPSSVVLAAMDALDVFVSRDAEVREAYINLMRDNDMSSTARVRAAEVLLPGADEALKRVIADSMEELAARLYRSWRRGSFTSAPRLIERAIEVVGLIDPERAEEMADRYLKPPGLFERLLDFLLR